MSPIYTAILLGLTAAAANVFGGAIIVQRNWERRYLKYFVALGAGFMLSTAIVEVVPTSLQLGGRYAAFLILLGYMIILFFEHTVTPHFHFGEETHEDEFLASAQDLLSAGRFNHSTHFSTASPSPPDFWCLPGWVGHLSGCVPAQIPEGLHSSIGDALGAGGRSYAWGASVLLGAATLAGVLTMAVCAIGSERRPAAGGRVT
jgi:ZIP family zinc transporter/zinc and cadmium transporter